jgi:glucose/arabinose dehydrogenase
VVAEGGVLGLLLDREFETSRHIYFYYTFVADGGAVRDGRLTRVTLGRDDQLDLSTEVVRSRGTRGIR